MFIKSLLRQKIINKNNDVKEKFFKTKLKSKCAPISGYLAKTSHESINFIQIHKFQCSIQIVNLTLRAKEAKLKRAEYFPVYSITYCINIISVYHCTMVLRLKYLNGKLAQID